jgi:hypothetical protein
MTRSGIIRTIAASSVLVLSAAGCASNGDVNTVRSDAQEARALAEEANEKATLAAADAAAARTAAEAAAKDAQEANTKADRIFQRSLKK